MIFYFFSAFLVLDEENQMCLKLIFSQVFYGSPFISSIVLPSSIDKYLKCVQLVGQKYLRLRRYAIRDILEELYNR